LQTKEPTPSQKVEASMTTSTSVVDNEYIQSWNKRFDERAYEVQDSNRHERRRQAALDKKKKKK